MRGTLVCGLLDKAQEGIIPAYAGNTPACFGVAGVSWDHPRVCGEHTCCANVGMPDTGSSPRMRGTLRESGVIVQDIGIIPAYAGNTDSTCTKSPRDTGSSPRMRGTRISLCSFCPSPGIIPAYAGNTGGRAASEAFCRDHPRVCGEHRRGCVTVVLAWGSSPRMRGTPRRSRPHHLQPGIIPAYAGNTLLVCIVAAINRGSSPRMRGTPVGA